VNRFPSQVDVELVCPICLGVLDDPLQVVECEHLFCHSCIQEWITQEPTCPLDRHIITPAQLYPAPRVVRSLLSKLKITRDNACHGCPIIVRLEGLSYHKKECKFRQRRRRERLTKYPVSGQLTLQTLVP
jgi:E3 ubiquitin-protein ligase NRDP1